MIEHSFVKTKYLDIMSDNSDSWVPELLESQLHGHDPENEIEEQGVQELRVPRGPKRLPEMWSRVIIVSQDGPDDIGIYPIE